MLGFAPLAAAPLGAAGAGGVAYDASFSASATMTDGGIVARQVFATAVDEVSSGEMSAAVTASTFNAAVSFAADVTDNTSAIAAFGSTISDGADGSVTTSALIGFLVRVSESGTATDSALVEVSVFNAPVADGADMTDTVNNAAVMPVSISDAAEIDDANSASYLWNLINNAQSTSWTVVKTEN